MKIKHSTLFHQTVANLGMVHGHREITKEGAEAVYQAYARLEMEFCRLPEYSPEPDPMQGALRRVQPVGAGGIVPIG